VDSQPQRKLIALALLLACARKPAPPDAAPLPSKLAYAGSARCRDCHDKKHARWQKDWHARALAPAAGGVLGDFADAHFRGTSSEAWMRRNGDECVMRTHGPDGAAGDFRIDWVIGGKRMQDGITVLRDGRWQVLPVYWHTTGREWVDYTETKQGRLDPDHPFYWTNFRRNANHECLDCHVTGLDVKYDRGTRNWSTHFVEPGVACEACHGPGARHSETQEKADVFRPAGELGFALCGQCHGPRQPLFPMLDASHHYRPGDRYEDHFQPVLPFETGDFFVDGRPKTSSYEYQALLQSRCFRRGGATCLTCHAAPHETKVPANACTGCHKMQSDHAHHKEVTCVGCHMPPVLTGVLDAFADHALDVPAPGNHDIPDACGVCHAKWPSAKRQQALLKFWPDAAKRQTRRIRLATAFEGKRREDLEAVLADAEEAPTLRAAAANLLAANAQAVPALARALDDPEALVRARAAQALATPAGRSALDALARHSGDPVLSVRLAVALALAAFADWGPAQKLAQDPATQALAGPHLALALAAARQHDEPSVEREVERLLELMPYHTDALILSADLRARRGDLAAARERLEEALRFDSSSAAARKRLAVMDRK
jgi:hypothetical protein